MDSRTIYIYIYILTMDLEFYTDAILGHTRAGLLFKGSLPGSVDLCITPQIKASMYYNCKLPTAYGASDSLFFGDHEAK